MAFFGTKQYGRGNDTWLDSRAGVDTAKTGTALLSAFDTPEGYIPSGTPVVSNADGYLIPAGSEAPTGFVIGDFPVADALDDEGLPVAFIWTGRIKVANLPVEDFAVPATPGLFSYVGGETAAEPTDPETEA